MIFFKDRRKSRPITRHLDEMELSMYIDGFCCKDTPVSEEINYHMEICLECKKKVLMLIDIMRVA